MKKEKILVVDDTPEIVDLLNMILTGASYNVYVANNGTMALSITNKLRPDLIIMDVMMPGIDGYQTCELIKQNEKTKHIPILFLSALGKTRDRVKAFKYGAVDFMNKPIEQEELLARVKTHLTIVKLQNELSVKNKELEDKVNERTAELTKANKEILSAYTSLKETSKALMESEQRYKKLSNLSQEGILFHNEWVAVDMNMSLANIFGFTQSELYGKNLIKLLIPEKHHALIEENHHRKSTKPYQLEGIRKDKTQFPLELVDRHINQDDQQFVVTAFRDISTQNQLEKKLLNSIIDTEEKERSHFARELHDGLGPVLSMLKMFIEWLLDDKRGGDKEEIKKTTKATIDEAITIIREISNNISPHILIEFGLVAALKSYINRLKGLCNITIVVRSQLKKRLQHHTEVTLYRILVESINNTRKYADATKINITIEPDKDHIKVLYTDNGKGFDVDAVMKEKRGMGLYNMQDRIKTIGGKLKIDSIPNKGIVMIINIKN